MPSSRRSKRRFGWRARLLLCAVATVVALLCGEILIRTIGMAPEVKPLWLSQEDSDDLAYMRSRNPILGFELKPSYRNDNADLSISVPRTNTHGQRDVERTVEKPKGHERILLLGDSVVEGHGLAAVDDTMSQQLEHLLTDGTTEVLNFGVSGYCTRAEVELLEVKGLKFDPDTVVVVFTENDFQNFNPEALQVDTAVERPEFVKQLFLYSELFRVCCIQFNWFRFGVEVDPVAWNQQAIGDNNVTRGLQRLNELQADHGFECLIAVWPRFTDDGFDDLHQMPDSDDLVIERLGRVYGFPVIRLSESFQQLPSDDDNPLNPRRQLTTGDGLHPSPEGNRMAAQFLKAALTQLRDGEFASAQLALPPDERITELAAIEEALARNQSASASPHAAYAVGYNNTGQQLEREGKLNEARRHYEMALEVNPQYAEAMCNLGSLALLEGGDGEAMLHYEAALKVNPNLAPAHLGIGLLHARAGRTQDAFKRFSEVLRIDPDSEKAHFNLGALYNNQGDLAAASRHFGAALRINRDSVEAMFHLANLKLQLGDPSTAEHFYHEVLELDPLHVPAMTNLGIVLSQRGAFNEARRRFLRALEIDPGSVGARQNLAALEQQIAEQKLQQHAPK